MLHLDVIVRLHPDGFPGASVPGARIFDFSSLVIIMIIRPLIAIIELDFLQKSIN